MMLEGNSARRNTEKQGDEVSENKRSGESGERDALLGTKKSKPVQLHNKYKLLESDDDDDDEGENTDSDDDDNDDRQQHNPPYRVFNASVSF